MLLVEQLTKPVMRADLDSGLRLVGGGRTPGDYLFCLKGKHFPYTDTSRQSRCIVCYDKKTADNKRMDTKVSSYFPKCQKHMCIGICFEEYHTVIDYKH